MYRISYLIFALTILFSSCNSDDDSGNSPEEENFYALTVGNSWEYEYYRWSNSSQEFTPIDFLLKKSITNAVELNGETYFTIETVTSGTDSCLVCDAEVQNELVRDSLGYLVNDTGKIIFSNNNEEAYLIYSEAFGDVFGKLLQGATTVDVNAGEFVALRNLVYAIMADGEPGLGSEEHLFSNGIGMVSRSISGINTPYPLGELRLKAYNLVGN